VAAAAAAAALGLVAWWRRRGRTAAGDPRPEPTLAEAQAFAAARAAERQARALDRLRELRERLADAAARCDAYLDGEAEGIGPPEPPWRPYADAAATALGDDREACVVVAAACRGMETVADAPTPERVEPVRRMIGRALQALERVLR
jgi:hypothetical protein